MDYVFNFIENRIQSNNKEIGEIEQQTNKLKEHRSMLLADNQKLNRLLSKLPAVLEEISTTASDGYMAEQCTGTFQDVEREKHGFPPLHSAQAVQEWSNSVAISSNADDFKNPDPPANDRKGYMRFVHINKLNKGKWIYVFRCDNKFYYFEYHARHIVTEQLLKSLRFIHASPLGVYTFTDGNNTPYYFHPVNFDTKEDNTETPVNDPNAKVTFDGLNAHLKARAVSPMQSTDEHLPLSNDILKALVYSYTQPSLFPNEKPTFIFNDGKGKEYKFEYYGTDQVYDLLLRQLSYDRMDSAKHATGRPIYIFIDNSCENYPFIYLPSEPGTTNY